jgi:hypothetical protein
MWGAKNPQMVLGTSNLPLYWSIRTNSAWVIVMPCRGKNLVDG